MIKKLSIEFIGTFILVFYLINFIYADAIYIHLNGFGVFFLISALVYAFKDVSNAHFNPLLTLSLLIVN